LGTDNDDYVNGQGFCCTDKGMQMAAMDANIGGGNDNPEKLQFYYHSDHLGSTSLITDLDGNVVQHVEYIPFGEVFLEERNNKWNTPYLFNGKELDEETGLYYYGARYYNPRESVWLSVDQLVEMTGTPYQYAYQNPVKFIDPIGMSGEDPPILYHNTDNAPEVLKEGFNATKYGKYSNYNWFSTTADAAGTGRTGQGTTLGVEGIDVSNAHTITKAQTTAWRLEAMKELGYTDDALKSLQKADSKAYGRAMSQINGAMYSKVGKYMDDMRKGVYYLAKDGAYAISDAVANKGVIKTFQGSAAAMNAIKGMRIGGRVLGVVAIGLDLYEIHTSGYEARTITKVAGGWAGAWAGGVIGAKAGAIGGGAVGVWCAGVGAAPGAAAGGFFGGLGGGIVGYFAGREITETVYDYVTTSGVKRGK